MCQQVLATATVQPQIHSLSDLKAAELIAKDGFDILVDMKGHIFVNHSQIIRHRPSPIIVNNLAYPATNASTTDYIITDLDTFKQ